jgi:hypothetical protein
MKKERDKLFEKPLTKFKVKMKIQAATNIFLKLQRFIL